MARTKQVNSNERKISSPNADNARFRVNVSQIAPVNEKDKALSSKGGNADRFISEYLDAFKENGAEVSSQAINIKAESYEVWTEGKNVIARVNKNDGRVLTGKIPAKKGEEEQTKE